MEHNDFETIKNLLKGKFGNTSIPAHYGYKLDSKKKELILLLKEKGLTANMQDDAAAFESWAIVLKCYLPEHIDSVVIDWEADITENKHYNRFVYRLAKFVQTYSWAHAAKPLPPIPSVLKCNISNQEAAEIKEHAENSEGWLECKYVLDHQAEYDVMNHQFPVGVFDGIVSRSTHFTTGGKSAIDMWAIKDSVFSIFELKLPENKPLGIISELMFYTNIIDDLLNHEITFDEGNKLESALKHNYRSFSKFYNAYDTGNIRSINAIMLADNLHTLITDDVLKVINDSPRWRYKNITFSTKKVTE